MEKIYRVKLNRNGAPNFSTAVETGIVPCKDCVHWQLLTSPFGLCVWNEDNKRQMEETGFCSCGVKR